MNIGEINTLKVLRETDIAYLLTDGTNEVFLHKKEAKKPYVENEDIEVFLYVDHEGRITASTKTPHLLKNQVGVLEVVSIHPKLGVFLNNGIVKDLLLSLDDLPPQKSLWPEVGDHVVVMMIEKKDNLLAHIIGRKQVKDYFPDQQLLADGEAVDAFVMYRLDHGLICFTEEGHEIFIHHNNYREDMRLGQAIHPKILKQNPDGAYVGTLIGQKEEMLDADAETILAYLGQHHGHMPYTDKSSPDDISDNFHMSKAAFKRALGRLYKAQKIILKDNQTILKQAGE